MTTFWHFLIISGVAFFIFAVLPFAVSRAHNKFDPVYCRYSYLESFIAGVLFLAALAFVAGAAAWLIRIGLSDWKW